ncbi:TGS domain-containing protein [Candidatus Woesearchaeota archaeon]|nr:TGS domain-containing protein [Candidatus Woesearchaeota archaeon]
MTTNAGFEYGKAVEKYQEARTDEEKLKALDLMFQTAPKHKSSEKLLKDIKIKISKIKAKLEKEKSKKKGRGYQLTVKKEGIAQIVILGVANSGRSFLLSKLTNAKPIISDIEYTTKLPEQGIMELNGMKIQLVEIPAIIQDFVNKENGGALSSIIRNADLIIVLLRKNLKEELNLIISELDKANIKLNEEIRESYVTKSIKAIIVVNKEENFKIKDFNVYHINESLPFYIWKNLDKFFVYTKSPKRIKDWPPVALNKDSTVGDLASVVHKDFIKKFKYAKIWGSSKFPGQTVGLDYKLKEGDIVEFHIKK